MDRGRKKLKKIAGIVGIVLFWCMALHVQASSLDERIEEIRVEQVQSLMPHMRAYCYYEGENPEDVKAAFNGKELVVEGQERFRETGAGIHYYMLLDVSASVSKEYFAGIKTAVGNFQKGMNDNDHMTIITFGDEVKLLGERLTASDDANALLNEVENRDMNTLLFQAIDQTASLIGQDADIEERNVIIAITDGEDFSENKATGNEALRTLNEKNIPLYAMAVKRTNKGKDNPYIDEFGEFSRSTGGYLTIFETETVDSSLQALKEELGQAWVLRLLASDNDTFQTALPLTLEFSNGRKATVSVIADRNIPDTVPPEATLKKTGSRKLQVSYSEEVDGADKKENFIVKSKQGEQQAVYAVSYDPAALISTLTFAEDLENGDYTVQFRNICDTSMETNPITGSLALVVKDAPIKEPEKEEKSFPETWWMLLAGAALMIIVGGVAAAVYFSTEKKKSIVLVDNQKIVASDVQVKQHIALQKQEGRSLIFELKDANQKIKQIPVMVNGSVIIGRTDISDVYFDDESLSRQHFAISDENGVFYIEDLNSRNGTMINGIRIHTRRALSNGDVIYAGRLEMKVRWQDGN